METVAQMCTFVGIGDLRGGGGFGFRQVEEGGFDQDESRAG